MFVLYYLEREHKRTTVSDIEFLSITAISEGYKKAYIRMLKLLKEDLLVFGSRLDLIYFC